MAGTDISSTADGNAFHDYTYYGNGCTGYDGSTKSCSLNTSKTFDNETQFIGVYYTYQAAVTGSLSSTTATDYTIISDSFCPLGWQLPYSGTGGDYYDNPRSWNYYLNEYAITNDIPGSKTIRSYPHSFIYGGAISMTSAKITALDSIGRAYSNTIYGYVRAYTLYIGSGNVKAFENEVGTAGIAIRCVKFLASFIDGTVAGTPADLTVYIDENATHDHTYYGRGCKNGWGTSGEGGSQTPCADSDAGGRYVKTADNETQKNGTYYNFQAATVGAGGAMATNKTDSSYTFCPLGWQLPYSGTGGDYDDKSRSWNHLFKSYGLHIGDGTATDAIKVKSYPFSYVYSGVYYWYTGRLYNQSNFGYYWSSTVVSSTSAYLLGTWPSVVRPAYTNIKGYGVAVRCGFMVGILTYVDNWLIFKT